MDLPLGASNETPKQAARLPKEVSRTSRGHPLEEPIKSSSLIIRSGDPAHGPETSSCQQWKSLTYSMEILGFFISRHLLDQSRPSKPYREVDQRLLPYFTPTKVLSMATTNTRKRSSSKAASKTTSSKKTTAKANTKKTTKTKATRTTSKKTAKGTDSRAKKAKKTSRNPKTKKNPREQPLRVPTPELSNSEKKKIEEARLMKIWKVFKKTDDDNLRNILVETHFPLVKYIAERLLQTLPRSIELGDLISAGTFGLMDAIRGFDLKRGIKFKTYCSTRIRGAILDELRSQDWVPRLVRLKAHRLQKAIAKLEAKSGNEVNDYDLAREMDISIQELSALKTEASPKAMFSLSDKIDDGEDRSDMEKVEIIEDKKGCDPIQAMQQQDVLELITRNLTKKERLIIIMYYYEGLTMREIGDIMSLTESRVCQIHSNVMSRLKIQIQTISHEGLGV